MSEQRLIDANAFKECWKPGVIGDTLRRVIDDQPTIDLETLPIVRELREKLDNERKICDDLQRELVRVAKERDAARNELLECALLLKAQCICCVHFEDRKPCANCKNGSEWEHRVLDGDHQ